jgi:hypothetical protein
MSRRQDAKRVRALVEAVEALATGERMTLGAIASKVFGWSDERVFLAIDAAVHSKLIARNKDGAILPLPEAAR